MMDDFEELEKKYFREKETREVQIAVTTFCCPICDARLHSHIRNLGGDCCEMKAVIDCDRCKMFHAESAVRSYYDRDKENVDAVATQDVMDKVRPYIRHFGGPLSKP